MPLMDPLRADLKFVSARTAMPDFSEHEMLFRLQHDDLVDWQARPSDQPYSCRGDVEQDTI